MKELSIEQKAQAYDKALERAKSFELPEYKNIMASVFHELQESDDERIRKGLLYVIEHHPTLPTEEVEEYIAWLEKQGKEEYALKSSKDEDVHKFVKCIEKQARAYDIELPNRSYDIYAFAKDILYWLEKQGEQKDSFDDFKAKDWYASKVDGKIRNIYYSVDKVEPKFKVGDWVTINNREIGLCPLLHIVDFGETQYSVEDVDGNSGCPRIEYLENHYHLWTIQDAKDGDVLATSAGAFIYNGNNGGGSCPGSYCGIDNLGEFKTGVEHHWTGKKVYPATIEQRNLLFQKIHEAGYMWDSESKQLLSLKAEPIGEQKPVELSGDDKIRLNNLIWLVEQSNENTATKKRFIDFINRLKSMLC